MQFQEGATGSYRASTIGPDMLANKDLDQPGVRRAKPRAWELRRLTAAADKIREREYGRLARNAEAAAEILPERDPQLGTSLGQSEEGVATVASNVAAGAAADLSLGHVTADIPFGAIGVQGDFRSVEHCRFGLHSQSPTRALMRRFLDLAARGIRSPL